MKNVLGKIDMVRADVGAVSKDGRNESQKYSYQSWESVLDAVRAACIKHQLVILPSTVGLAEFTTKTKYGENPSIVVTHRFTVCDVESGESVDLDWAGQAILMDDKAVNKSGTAAYKYFVLKLFQISVNGDDTDNDAHEGAGALPVTPRTAQTAPQDASGYELPLKAMGLQRAQKKATDGGIDWDSFVAECKKQNATNTAQCGEILDGMLKVSA